MEQNTQMRNVTFLFSKIKWTPFLQGHLFLAIRKESLTKDNTWSLWQGSCLLSTACSVASPLFFCADRTLILFKCETAIYTGRCTLPQAQANDTWLVYFSKPTLLSHLYYDMGRWCWIPQSLREQSPPIETKGMDMFNWNKRHAFEHVHVKHDAWILLSCSHDGIPWRDCVVEVTYPEISQHVW